MSAKIVQALFFLSLVSATALTATTAKLPIAAHAAVGDVVATINLDSIIDPAQVFCSIGVAFDGENLYVDACGNPNIYKITTTGSLVSTFDVVAAGASSNPNALAFDAKRNGIWFGGQFCGPSGMDIHFWDFDDNSVTLMFTIPFNLTNPATGNPFVFVCFNDGLAYNENDPATDADDELWFSDDVSQELGLFRPTGVLVKGYNASTVDPSLTTFNEGNSGIAIGGQNLYLANNGGGDVFRADKNTDPLVKIDQFVTGDNRQEDMECDPITFAPTEVMWVRTTPQGGAFPNVLTAYEIEPNTCRAGGGSEEPPEPALPGRMTGGGAVTGTNEATGNTVRVTHGFELHCNATQLPNNLQVNWGRGNSFHLESLDTAACSDDPNISEAPPVAGFDTYKGTGTGTYNGVSGAAAQWKFTDAGEPGTNDTIELKIKDSNGVVILQITGKLANGNHQAHEE